MNNSNIQQIYSFITYFISGIAIGIIFDTFRILRKSFKTSDLITYIEDILFWIITDIILIALVFSFSEGEVRIYNFIGMIIGIIIYLLLISKYFIRINVKILTFFKKVIYKVFKIVSYPFIIIYKSFIKIIKPITFFVINIKKDTKKSKKLKIKEGF